MRFLNSQGDEILPPPVIPTAQAVLPTQQISSICCDLDRLLTQMSHTALVAPRTCPFPLGAWVRFKGNPWEEDRRGVFIVTWVGEPGSCFENCLSIWNRTRGFGWSGSTLADDLELVPQSLQDYQI